MSEWRRAKNRTRKDGNEDSIVDALEKIPNLSVQIGHDDILVGYLGQTYWYEIKDPDTAFNKDGTFKKGAIKPSQEKLLGNWKGHYKIVWNLEMILDDMGIKTDCL